MKHMFKAAALASVVIFAGASKADVVPATLRVGEDFTHPFSWGYVMPYNTDYLISGLHGEVSLTFSNFWSNSEFFFIEIWSAPVQGASVNFDGMMNTAAIDATVQSLHGTFDGDTGEFTVRHVETAGGISFNTPGGSIQLTDIRFDLAAKAIHARIDGSNGIGTRADQLLWRFDELKVEPADYMTEVDATIFDITPADGASGLFAQALGLGAMGRSWADRLIDDMAIELVFSASRTQRNISAPDARFAIAAPIVPEPSTYVLMGLGLVGLAFARRRARHPSKPVTTSC